MPIKQGVEVSNPSIVSWQAQQSSARLTRWAGLLLAAMFCLLLLSPSPALADEPSEGDNQGLASPEDVPEWAKDLPVQFVPTPTEEVPIIEEEEEGEPDQPNAVGPDWHHLPYHGGQVQNQIHVHLIFWGSNWNQHDAARDRVVEMFQWMSGSSWMGILSQYFDLEGPISREVALSSFTDGRQDHPTNVSENSLDNEATWAIANQGWGPARFDDQFIVLAAPGSTFAPNFVEGCGYHSYSFNHGINVLNVPWPTPGTPYQECMSYFPPGAPEWYHLQVTAAHEFAEAATDPIPPRKSNGQFAGWSLNSTIEIGNMCRGNGVVMVAAGILLPRIWDNYLAAANGQSCAVQDANPVRYQVQGPQANVSPRQAAVSGSVTPAGYSADYQFQLYAGGQLVGSQPASPQGVGAGFGPVGVAHTFAGLKGSTAYTAKLVTRSELTQHPDTGNFTPIIGETSFTTPDWRPAVTTSTPTYPVPHEGRPGGTVNPQGGSTSYQIEWGPTTAYGSTVPIPAASIGNGTSPVAVSQAITGLKGNTTYHFRIVATNDEGTTFSPDQPFTTPDWRPLVQTQHASGITEEEATLEGKVNPQLRATTYQFEYGETQSYGTTVPVSPVSAGSGNAFVAVQERIGGLKPETLYYYRLKATNEEGTSYSDVDTFETFTTKATPATFDLAFGGHGSGNGQLNDPRGIAVDSAGDVWVADTGNDRVVKFDPEGQFILAAGEGANEELSEPVDVAADEDGTVWVAEGSPPRLVHFSAQGQLLSERVALSNVGPINSLTVASGQRIIASHQTEDIYRLVEYAPGKSGYTLYLSYGWWASWSELTGLTTNAAGNEVFAVNGTLLKRLQEVEGKFKVCGTAIFGEIKDFGPAEGQVDHPRGIAVRPSGNVLVADTGNERVQQFSPTGEVIGGFRAEAAESEAAAPIDIAVGPGGAEYITTSAGGDQVEKWLQPSLPEAVTGEASGISETEATVHGVASAVGRASTYRFEYGTSSSYGKSAPAPEGSLGIGFDLQNVSATLTGLAPGVEYHYRLASTNKQGTTYGVDKTFKTEGTGPLPPEQAFPQMAVIEPFNTTASPSSDFATGWSALGWSAGGTTKGTNTEAGWQASAAFPAISGAAFNTTATDTGDGVATVATMSGIPTGEGERYFALWLDMPTPTGTKAGYELRITRSAGTPAKYTASLSKWQGGTETSLGSKSGQTFPIPTTFAIADRGSQVSAWADTGAGFSEIVGATDSTFSGGASGISGSGNTTRLTKFKAGPMVAASNPTDTAIKGLTLIDSFTTVENPLSRSGTFLPLQWDVGTAGKLTGRVVEAGWRANDAYGKVNGAYWKGTTFSDAGNGDGVTATVTGGPDIWINHTFSLWLNMPDPGTAKNGYQLRFVRTTGTYTVSLVKFVSGAETVLASKTAYKIIVGSKIALLDKGSTVSVWADTGAGFYQLLSASDSAFSSGYLGIEGAAAYSTLADLRGGALGP